MVVKAISPQASPEQKPIRDKSIILPPQKNKYTDLVKIMPSVNDEKPIHGNIKFPFGHYAIIERRLGSDTRSDDERRSDLEAREESTDDATRDDGPSYVLTGELDTASSEEYSFNYEAHTGYSHEAPTSLFSFFFGSGGTIEEELSVVSSDSTIGTIELEGHEAVDEAQLGHVSVRMSTLKWAIGNQEVNETVQTVENNKSESTLYILSPPLHTSRGLKINSTEITKRGFVSDLLETSLLCSPLPAHTPKASGGRFVAREFNSIGKTLEIVKSESTNSMVESKVDAKDLQTHRSILESLFCVALPHDMTRLGPTDVQGHSERKLNVDSAIDEENEVVWGAHKYTIRQAKETNIPVTTCERFLQDSIQSSSKVTESTGSLVEVAAEEASCDPELKIPLRRRNELSRQKTAVLHIFRKEKAEKAEESNLHKELVQKRTVVSDLCFLDEMDVPTTTRDIVELVGSFCVLVLTLGKYGRMEGDMPSQLDGPQHSTSDQKKKLNESAPKAFQQLLKKRLRSRASYKRTQVPIQSPLGQAVRDLCFIGSSGRLERFEDSLFFETLSPKCSARINNLKEQDLPVPGSGQHDPKEPTETDMAAKEQISEIRYFDEEPNAEPNEEPNAEPNAEPRSDGRKNQAEKGEDSTKAAKKKVKISLRRARVTPKFSEKPRSRLDRLIGSRRRKKNPKVHLTDPRYE
jgi:hypothetical protein